MNVGGLAWLPLIFIVGAFCLCRREGFGDNDN